MNKDETLQNIQQIIAEIMDIETDKIQPQTFLILQLGIESIDLLEIAVDLAGKFQINVEDDLIFLTKLRVHHQNKENLGQIYPHLTQTRLEEIEKELPQGAVLKVTDIIDYIQWRQK